MRFIDEARIEIKAGHGGRGCVSFMREKYIPRGRPNGGNGGRGAHIILKVDTRLTSLLDYKYRQHFEAPQGANGEGSDRTGRDGEDIILPVPMGTLIFDDTTGDLLVDLSQPDQKIIVARGGRGGKGNAHFTSATNQGPRFAQPGEPGETLTLRLELKLLADVGLIGLPNAGKSSLISRLTAARPKIADYPFTTLNPQLGVVKGPSGTSFVIADIPGLIEGASTGAGLGLEFLKHVERSHLLVHLIDISPDAPTEPDVAYKTINNELKAYARDLTRKPQWIALTKTDVCSPEDVERWKKRFARTRKPVFALSSATGSGLNDLVNKLVTSMAESKRPIAPAAETHDTQMASQI